MTADPSVPPGVGQAYPPFAADEVERWQAKWNDEVTEKALAYRRLNDLRRALADIADDPRKLHPYAAEVARKALASDDAKSFRNPLGSDDDQTGG